jgi:alpha-galactosidase
VSSDHETIMPGHEVDEVELPDVATARVYEHGWQSWSPTACYPAAATSARPAHAWQLSMRFRPEVPAPQDGFQAEGLLVVDPGQDEPVRVYSAQTPAARVPSIRARLTGRTLEVTADGPVRVDRVPGTLNQALARLGERLGATMGVAVRPAPTVWCSWYHYFLEVTESDIVENLEAIEALDLPVDVVQVDDGWEAGIGDWLALSDRFSSTEALAARIRDGGRRAGIWLAPFIAGADSALAREHPDWLLGDAGHNWDQPLHGLDLTHPGVQAHLHHVFTGLRAQGYDYFKLDFLYGGALLGPRHEPCTGEEAYRAGLQVIRDAVGPDGYLLGCGAPMLPSIGIVDAMRVSSDTYDPTDSANGQDVLRGRANIEARAWQQGRLWVNDSDSLVARPQFDRREAWASVIEAYGGLRSVSDRVGDLDDWGLETTRRVLSSAPPPVPFASLPELCDG